LDPTADGPNLNGRFEVSFPSAALRLCARRFVGFSRIR
jgi:hypothetical protein